MIKTYYTLAKPGIIYGNVLVAAGGFWLASGRHVHLLLFGAMVFGLALIIGSACVFNNYMDRDIDRLMERTAKRSLVTGIVSPSSSLLYATALGVAGSVILLLFTNALTLALALLGHFFYVVVYGLTKRKTVYGTLIGSISGSLPPVVGYCAVTNHLDIVALLLFLLLVAWQMPHFYAIALYRKAEYAAAGIPVLPVVSGEATAKLHIIAYIGAYCGVAVLLMLYGPAKYLYLILTLGIGLFWMRTSFVALREPTSKQGARKSFRVSLIAITAWCFTIPLDAWVR